MNKLQEGANATEKSNIHMRMDDLHAKVSHIEKAIEGLLEQLKDIRSQEPGEPVAAETMKSMSPLAEDLASVVDRLDVVWRKMQGLRDEIDI